MEANELKSLIFKRTGLESKDLQCPREKTSMTPCVARDGDLAMTDDKICVGCNCNVLELLTKEQSRNV